MAHIYIQYFKGILLRRTEYIILGAFLLALFASVSIQSVFNNIPKDNLEHASNFLFVAVRDTEWTIQGVLAAVILWACFVIFRFSYRFPWKKIDFLKYFGLLKIRY